MAITLESILNQFDSAAGEFTFPMMDNGYVYPADVRMSVYRDESRWLMMIEVLGAYSPRTCGCDSFQNCLHLFGNTFGTQCGTQRTEILYPIVSLPDAPLFQDQYDWYINPEAKMLGIRDHRITFDVSEKALEERGISLLEPPKIDPPAVLRSLLPEYRDLLFATAAELASRNKDHLPLLMRLDEWFHPNLADGELPSNCETFRMLAEVIVSNRIDAYKPTKKPNTHWRNWPEGGTL